MHKEDKGYYDMNVLEKVDYWMSKGYSEDWALREIASENGEDYDG